MVTRGFVEPGGEKLAERDGAPQPRLEVDAREDKCKGVGATFSFHPSIRLGYSTLHRHIRLWYCSNVCSVCVFVILRCLQVATLQTQLRSGEARIRGLERHVGELMRRVSR